MIIIINYKGRKTELVIDGTDTVKNILEKFYIKINKNENERFYTRDKVILKNGVDLLNTKENLCKTRDELDFEEDDNFELINAGDINPGKQIISLR